MMSLNLKTKMRWLLLAGLFPLCSQAQDKSIFSAGGGISPYLGGAINRGGAYEAYRDSVHSTDGIRGTAGVFAWASYALYKKVDLQVGLGYMECGFSRRQSGLDFLEATYPGIGTGRIEDKSNTKKAITYNYKFAYLQVPVLFNFYVKRSGNFKWVYNITAGITGNILLKHRIQANMDPGFSIEGKSTYKLDSTGFAARRVTANVVLGAMIQYRSDKKTSYFVQPLAGFFPMSVSAGNPRSYPWFVTVNVGVLYDLF